MKADLLDACHLWQVDLTRETGDSQLLDAAERERAARFRFDRDRARFTACRVALRTILGTYLDCAPERITLRTREHGRPYLVDAVLDFNVSHSENLALIAVSSQPPLGVDLEALHEVKRAIDLARRYLHPEELRLVETTSPADRSAVFLTCWTRKEAVLKSTGAGLTLDTRTLNVGAEPVEKTLELPGFPPLRVFSPPLAAGYVAACATAPGVRRFEFRRFEL